jgi:hypothetical protein
LTLPEIIFDNGEIGSAARMVDMICDVNQPVGDDGSASEDEGHDSDEVDSMDGRPIKPEAGQATAPMTPFGEGAMAIIDIDDGLAAAIEAPGAEVSTVKTTAVGAAAAGPNRAAAPDAETLEKKGSAPGVQAAKAEALEHLEIAQRPVVQYRPQFSSMPRRRAASASLAARAVGDKGTVATNMPSGKSQAAVARANTAFHTPQESESPQRRASSAKRPSATTTRSGKNSKRKKP